MAPKTRLCRSTSARTWNTAGVPEAEQFGFWRDAVWEAFVPVSLSRDHEGGFASRVTARTVGALGVSYMVSQAQSVHRSHAEIQRRAGDVFFLNLPLTEGTSASQADRTAQPRKGDFVLIDSSRPFELGFERDFRQISVTLPHDCLAPLLAAPLEATAISVPGDRGVGAVASGAIRALASSTGPVDRSAGRAITEQIASLVALAVGGVQPRLRSRGRALLVQAALDEIERSLGDPELSPTSVAQRIGVSVRYLHELFAERGPSFGRWVLARRLERCHRDLADHARGHWTVADIAHHHGFRDASYFARAFKARYGLSPRQHRQLWCGPASAR